MPSEITIVIKMESSSHRSKELEYESFDPNNDDDPILKKHIDLAMEKVNIDREEIEDVIISTKTVRK